ncbi:2276_t:CDS:1, partial [Dentiscutata erythropus]
EETLVSKYGNSASILGFISLSDDQENLHKLYASNSTEFMKEDIYNLRRRERR